MRKNQWVLITGATSGIGYALTKLFAQNGYSLVLVSRNIQKLEEVKKSLSSFYVDILVYACDLCVEQSVWDLYNWIQEKKISIDILINNAGAGKVGTLIEQEENTVLDLLHLNVTTPTLLAQLFAKDMVRRDYGYILMVASTAAFGTDAGLNVYGPSKTYDYSLAQTLKAELSHTSVVISCLCPGPTCTNWSKNAGREESRWSMSANRVAQIAYKGLFQKKALIIPGLFNQCLYVGSKMIPDAWIGRITASYQKRLKKK